MPDEIIIRTACQNDLDNIARFNIKMAMETEHKTLSELTVTLGVQNLFDNPSLGFYLVAECDGQVVGSLMITYEWSDWRNAMFWWVQSVYIMPQFRRKGIFAKMYDHVKEMAAKKDNICGLRLYVEKDNDPAQATYENLGMKQAAYKFYEDLFEE